MSKLTKLRTTERKYFVLQIFMERFGAETTSFYFIPGGERMRASGAPQGPWEPFTRNLNALEGERRKKGDLVYRRVVHS